MPATFSIGTRHPREPRLPDARATVTDYIRTKQLQPNTILALRKLVEDTTHEVALYKEYKAVPPQEQANVRNDMYVPAKRSGS